MVGVIECALGMAFVDLWRRDMPFPAADWKTLRVTLQTMLFIMSLNSERLFEADGRIFMKFGKRIMDDADSVTYFSDSGLPESRLNP